MCLLRRIRSFFDIVTELWTKISKNPPCYVTSKDDLLGSTRCHDVTYMGKEEEVYLTTEKTTDFNNVDIFDLNLKSRKNKDGNDEHKVSAGMTFDILCSQLP